MNSATNNGLRKITFNLSWLFAVLTLLTTHCSLRSQQTQVYKPNVNRILFVLDGSGSMKQKWGEKTKFENAKELLSKIIDSVEQKNPNVEFAVRVFGHQFFRDQRNCKDSKLLIPFAKNNASKINSVLRDITPQGMSPVAYSIQLGAGDFPDDAKSLNSIVLITDGEENCEGDPCKISKELVAKRITHWIARTGTISSNGSGEIFLALSTASPKYNSKYTEETWKVISKWNLDKVFRATVEATEEAIINALLAAEDMEGKNGNKVFALPHQRLQAILQKYNR